MHGGRHAPMKNFHSKEWQESANRKREREKERKKLQFYAEGEDESCVGKIRIFKRKKAKGRENSFLNQVYKLRSMRHDRFYLRVVFESLRSLLLNAKKRGDSSTNIRLTLLVEGL